MKLLQRIAQATTSATSTTTTSQTTATAPTTAVTAPPAFQASSMYPGIKKGFNTASVQAIDNMVTTLNNALQYASGGAVNFQTLYNSNYNMDLSSVSDVDARNLAAFSQMLYRTLLNSGNEFAQPLNSQQIAVMVQKLSQSQPLNMLSQTNPTGQLAQKIPGNMKDRLLAYLQYLTNANTSAQR